MRKLIIAAVLAFATLSIGQSAFAYTSCTTTCFGNTCTTNCY